MKLNKKGFTLVELLAVIVILLAISVVAIPNISAAIERSKNKTNEKKKEVLASYGEIYFSEHPNDTSRCVNVGVLKTQKYISDEEAQDADGNDIGGSIKWDSASYSYKYYDSNC